MSAETLLMSDEEFARRLEPTAARLFERHLEQTEAWSPHKLVPYDQGITFPENYVWAEDEGRLKLVAPLRSALFVNLLTEDNLPYYFRDVEKMFGGDGPWGQWGRWWTAEEGRHSIVIRDFLTATRALDPAELEVGRMAQVSGGETPAPTSNRHGIIYLTLQELGTRVAHRNTGRELKAAGSEAGFEIMRKVAADENLHYMFYRDGAAEAFDLDPSGMIIALEEVVRAFAMPGTGIPDFEAHAKAIAMSGIYGLNEYHTAVLAHTLRYWRVKERTGLTKEAEDARNELQNAVARIGKLAVYEAKNRIRLKTAA